MKKAHENNTLLHGVLLCDIKHTNWYRKYFSYREIYTCRNGSAETTETRCRDGSVQARRGGGGGGGRGHTNTAQVTPSLHLF